MYLCVMILCFPVLVIKVTLVYRRNFKLDVSLLTTKEGLAVVASIYVTGFAKWDHIHVEPLTTFNFIFE